MVLLSQFRYNDTGNEVNRMRKTNQEVRSIYHKRQRQGMQDLRFLSLLLFLGLLLYTALNFYIVTKLTGIEQLMRTYATYAIGGCLLWCIPLRLLWSFNRLGRPVYWLMLGLNAYVYKDSFALFHIELEPMSYRMIFIVLLVLKCAMLVYGGGRLLFSSSIRSIWNVDDLFDDELEEMEMTAPATQSPIPKKSKVEEKAQQLLKRTAIRLGLCLYLSVLLIFVLLGLLGNSIPELSEAIGAIQFPLFSECLFSIMIWSIPVFGLYMGKPWSPYLIFVSILGELLRIGLSYTQYMEVFTNQIITTEIKLLYIAIELMRYVILFFSCHSVFSHPIIYAYRKGSKKATKQ